MELKERIKKSIELERSDEKRYWKLLDMMGLLKEDEDVMSWRDLARWCAYVRSELVKLQTEEAFTKIYECYKLSGRHNFDDYMSACEFYREPRARFWWPRRKVLEGKHKIASQIQDFMEDPTTRYLGFSMAPGTGKLLADDTPVLTSDGWKRHGDLVVGDEVIGLDGEFHKVQHVFPKDYANVRVWFTNGEYIDCHENHEWLVYDRSRRCDRIVETKEFFRMKIESGVTGKRGHRYRYLLPVHEAVKGIGMSRQRRISVAKVEKIAPVPGNCIQVEGGMYLVGRTLIPTHNSTMIKFLLAYISGRWPFSSNMYVSYSDGMVKMMLDSEKAILTDKHEYQHLDIFGNGRPTISSEYKTLTYKNAGDFPTLGLVALGGSVTGRTRANRFLVTDDLVKNAEEARSPERLFKLYEDYKNTLTTRMIGDDVKQIQLGTIWSYYDPISRMKAEHADDPAYKFIAIPVCDENGHSNFLYDHPDNYTDERIAEIRASLDPVDFSCLYMQQGIQKEGLAFPEGSLTYYNGTLPPVEPDKKVFFCDVAFGGGDSLAMPIGYVYGTDCYIPDVVFNRGDKTVTEPIVAGKIMSHGCQTGRFEANNGGDFYAEDINNLLLKAGYHCGVTTAKAPTTMSKVARIEQYAPDIRRFVFLDSKHRSEEYKNFMLETMTFSFTAKNLHDDAPDSLAGLACYLFEKPKAVTSPGKRWM